MKTKQSLKELAYGKIINRKTNIYHLRGETENCYSIKNVDSKYLIETTTKEEELLNIELKACKKCKIM